uniref:Uncharacterized protein n=1 Tax=viral metagenome TaxID=1070528 RepID=A0A6C0F548_9ZZZZ
MTFVLLYYIHVYIKNIHVYIYYAYDIETNGVSIITDCNTLLNCKNSINNVQHSTFFE